MNAPYKFACRIRDLESALKNCRTDISKDKAGMKQRLEEVNRIVDAALEPVGSEKEKEWLC